jgi:signal peptidase I
LLPMGIDVESPAEPSWLRRVVIGRNPKRTLARIVILVVTVFVVIKFVLLPIRVEGVSMLPTYKERRVNFVNRLAYSFHEPRRGDVVAIRLAGESIMFMKRIVALPGETVGFRDGHCVVNGQVLYEPYVQTQCNWEMEPELLGPNEYYVVGDNRSMSRYEHTQGKANRRRIVGKVLL